MKKYQAQELENLLPGFVEKANYELGTKFSIQGVVVHGLEEVEN